MKEGEKGLLYPDYKSDGHIYDQLSLQVGRILTQEKKKKQIEEARDADLTADQGTSDSEDEEGEDEQEDEQGD